MTDLALLRTVGLKFNPELWGVESCNAPVEGGGLVQGNMFMNVDKSKRRSFKPKYVLPRPCTFHFIQSLVFR